MGISVLPWIAGCYRGAVKSPRLSQNPHFTTSKEANAENWHWDGKVYI